MNITFGGLHLGDHTPQELNAESLIGACLHTDEVGSLPACGHKNLKAEAAQGDKCAVGRGALGRGGPPRWTQVMGAGSGAWGLPLVHSQPGVPAREVVRREKHDQASPSHQGPLEVWGGREVSRAEGGTFLSSVDPPSVTPWPRCDMPGPRKGREPPGRQGSGGSREASGEGAGPGDGHQADGDVGEPCLCQAGEQGPSSRPSVFVSEAGFAAELKRWV